MSFTIYCIEFITMVIIIITKIAAYDSNARFGLDNSERVVYQNIDDRLLAVHNQALD